MDDKQKQLCRQEPPHGAISHRKGGGNKRLSYLEGWYIIVKANEIFGEGRWSRGFTDDGPKELSRQVSQVQDKYDESVVRDRYDVAYTCTYEVEFDGHKVQDIGFGNGQSFSGYEPAIELAVKESVTDALKRCLRSFGNAFGNCLYDKQWLKDGTHKGAELPEGDEIPEASKPTSRAKPNNSPAPDKEQAGKKIFWHCLRDRANLEGITLPVGAEIKDFVAYLLGKLNCQKFTPAVLALQIATKDNDNYVGSVLLDYHQQKAS